MMRVALDTTILAYLAGVSHGAQDEAKIGVVRDMVGRLAEVTSLIAPTQALGELFVLLRRTGTPADEARTILLEFSDAFGVAPSLATTTLAAADLVVDHRLQYWDALILTAAAEAGCAMLLSEDMQHGFVTRGLTVINPLTGVAHPKLAALLDISV
ncbi:PIN domain-containing protein [Sphingobium sp. CCH11-B1]|jgi:predicted nucleic acid-binding protein|uniref:PIN domain-containing protein n=1 Tax=Sphingobium sp. CCH11-B1 TaxID=1768781 RepID=UPI00082FC585|nr:PIN domain-containing protein [Sphingobium sp. CCH11-B1]MEA3389664.1 PIN domain-containing protein [Pseudomonadota bacterium]